MSLLMDALKKAEQEKREAANKLKSPEQGPALLKKDDKTDTAAARPAEEKDIAAPQPVFPVERPYRRSVLDLSLEPIEQKHRSSVVERGDPPGKEEVAARADVEEEAARRNPVPAVAQDPSPPELEKKGKATDRAVANPVTVPADSGEDGDRTFHGVSLEKGFSSELYEDTVQGEAFKPEDAGRLYDETLPGVPAAQLARDIGTKDQPTPVAAQTIFTASSTARKPSPLFKGVLIALCLTAVISALVFIYSWTTPISREIPSPMVARGVETIIPSQPIGNANLTAAAPAMEASANVAEAVDLVGDLAAAPAQRPEQDTPGDTKVELVEPGPEPGLAGVNNAPITEQSPSLPHAIEPPPSLIRITRSSSPIKEDRLVREAFTAYQQGNYALARAKYEEAQATAPDNRDVLLGLAAVAGRSGDAERALRLYLRLLDLNPLDNIARAAILGMRQDRNSAAGISTIRTMLHDSPDQPLLYFTLGKLQASQARWPEAQQAFFDAYRLDSANPDYALNLAVSLDRLGQAQTALDYYNVALELAKSTAAGFEPGTVAERIKMLEAR